MIMELCRTKALVIGYGSIGKRHAAILDQLHLDVLSRNSKVA